MSTSSGTAELSNYLERSYPHYVAVHTQCKLGKPAPQVQAIDTATGSRNGTGWLCLCGLCTHIGLAHTPGLRREDQDNLTKEDVHTRDQ